MFITNVLYRIVYLTAYFHSSKTLYLVEKVFFLFLALESIDQRLNLILFLIKSFKNIYPELNSIILYPERLIFIQFD